MISRDPEALYSVVGGKAIWEWFPCLSAKNRSSNYDEVNNLLRDCCVAFKQHRFPRLIELCSTSDALEVLLEAHAMLSFLRVVEVRRHGAHHVSHDCGTHTRYSACACRRPTG